MAGYRRVSETIMVDQVTEQQFREIERLLGHPPFWLGRYKTGRNCCFDPATQAIGDGVCVYLRERGLAHSREIDRRWKP